MWLMRSGVLKVGTMTFAVAGVKGLPASGCLSHAVGGQVNSTLNTGHLT